MRTRLIVSAVSALLLVGSQVATAQSHHHAHRAKKHHEKHAVHESDSLNTQELEHSGITHEFGLDKLQIHGFLNAGYARTDVEGTTTDITGTTSDINYIGIDNRGSFDPVSWGGLQFTMPFNQKYSATMQLVARGRGASSFGGTAVSDDFDVKMIWAYLKAQLTPNLSVKLGRYRTPLYMMSEYLDVGYAYPWVTPPEPLYNTAPVPNINGVDVYYKKYITEDWFFAAEPFYGSSDTTISGIQGKLRNIWGSSVTVGNDWLTLRAVYMRVGGISFNVNSGMLALDHVPGQYYGAGIKVDKDNFLFISEYGKGRVIDSFLGGQRAYYATLGYHIGKFLPTLTYTSLRSTNTSDHARAVAPIANALIALGQNPIVANAAGQAYAASLSSDQDTWELGLRYNVNAHLALKADYERIMLKNGTQGLFSGAPTKNNINAVFLAATMVF